MTMAGQLREATWGLHQEAEHVTFVQDLLAGRLPLSDYARMVVQHRAVYAALEEAVAANTDPVVAMFLAPELTRLPAIDADLAFLGGGAGEVLPSTAAYCAHLRAECSTHRAALLAHHYVRYLGDLSGGQVIGRVLRRVYGFVDERGTSFYDFSELSSVLAFKTRYREQLDALSWGEDERALLVLEAATAYRLNSDVFLELGEQT